MQKGELDPAEFRTASGWYLEGWLESRECETDSGERRREELLTWVRQL